jgi:putative holliday junction resolvase
VASSEIGGAGTRALGIDLGERRIGVAVGDLAERTSMPLVTLGRAKKIGDDATTIARVAAEQGANLLVVGLPLDMDGSEGPQAAKTREWAEAISEITGLQLRMRDERLTSERAERRIGRPARGRSGGPPSASARDSYRARIDREAAALILQDEIDATSADAERGA